MKSYQQQTQAAYDRIAATYAQRRFVGGHESELEQQLQDFISHLPATQGKILDLGCGPGHHSKFFSDKGFSVIGLDYSQAMITQARKHVPEVKFLQQDMLNMSFKPKSFIGVWAAASLFHVEKLTHLKLFQQINSFLVSNGLFFAAMKKGRGERMETKPKYGITISRFHSLYSKTEFKALLAKAGFDFIKDYDWVAQTGRNWFGVLARKTRG